jgi:hypothetical protein
VGTKRGRRVRGKARAKAAAPARKAPKQAESDPNAASSQRDLARKLGVASITVSRWTRRPDWPFGAPPWNVKEIQAWRELNLAPDPAAPAMAERRAEAQADPLSTPVGGDALHAHDAKKRPMTWKERNDMERALFRHVQRMEKLNKLHDVDACRRNRLQQIHTVKARLLIIPRSLAPELVGLDRRAIEKRLDAAILSALSEFAADVEAPETA